jgi:hypothetical protein
MQYIKGFPLQYGIRKLGFGPPTPQPPPTTPYAPPARGNSPFPPGPPSPTPLSGHSPGRRLSSLSAGHLQPLQVVGPLPLLAPPSPSRPSPSPTALPNCSSSHWTPFPLTMAGDSPWPLSPPDRVRKPVPMPTGQSSSSCAAKRGSSRQPRAAPYPAPPTHRWSSPHRVADVHTPALASTTAATSPASARPLRPSTKPAQSPRYRPRSAAGHAPQLCCHYSGRGRPHRDNRWRGWPRRRCSRRPRQQFPLLLHCRLLVHGRASPCAAHPSLLRLYSITRIRAATTSRAGRHHVQGWPPPRPGLAATSRAGHHDPEPCHWSRSAAAGAHVGRPLRRLSGRGGLLPLGRSRPFVPSSPASATSSLAWLPCAPLPCAGISTRASPRHHTGHLVTTRTDTPAAPPTSSFSRRRRQTTPCQVRSKPLPGWTRPVALPFIAFVGSFAVMAFSVGFTVATTFPDIFVVPSAGSSVS